MQLTAKSISHGNLVNDNYSCRTEASPESVTEIRGLISVSGLTKKVAATRVYQNEGVAGPCHGDVVMPALFIGLVRVSVLPVAVEDRHVVKLQALGRWTVVSSSAFWRLRFSQAHSAIRSRAAARGTLSLPVASSMVAMASAFWYGY